MKTCKCGGTYRDDPGGRNNHKLTHGHPPVEDK